MLKVLFVEEHTSAYERKLSVCTSDAMGAAVRLMVRRPERGEGAAVEDARERPEDSAVCDDEDGLGLALERDDRLVEKTPESGLDLCERLASFSWRVARRILESGTDIVVGERVDGRPFVRPEVDLVKAIVNDGLDTVRRGENLGGMAGAAIGAHERTVETESGGDEAVASQFSLADTTCVDVDLDDAALDAHFAIPVRFAVPDEEDVHRRVLYHS